MKPKNLKALTLLIILFFASSSICIFIPQAKATTFQQITFAVTGSGSISWTDTTNTYIYNGITSSSYTKAIPNGDNLIITATPTAGASFVFFVYIDVHGTGQIYSTDGNGNGYIASPPVIENFNLTAHFSAVANHQVTVMTDNFGGDISWTYGAITGGVGRYFFPNGASVTFDGTAQPGYAFNYFVVTYGYTNQTFLFTSPTNLTVTSDFMITSYAYVLAAPYYNLTVLPGDTRGIKNGVGGSITANIDGNSTILNVGSYILPANVTIDLTASANPNYTFKGFFDYLNVQFPTVITQTPEQRVRGGGTATSSFILQQNETIYGEFQTDGFDLQVIGSSQNGNTYTIQQNATYQCYMTVTTNGTLGASGDFFIYATDISTDSTVATTGQYHLAVNQTRFTDGYFTFSTGSNSSLNQDAYRGLLIVVFWDGVTYNGITWAYGEEVYNLGATFSNLMFGTTFTLPVLKMIPTLGVTESQVYTIHFLPAGTSLSTPTPPPNIVGGFNLSWLWSLEARLIYGTIAIIGIALGLAYIMGKYGGRNGVAGLIIGMNLAGVINIFLFLWSPLILIITVVCTLFLLVYGR